MKKAPKSLAMKIKSALWRTVGLALLLSLLLVLVFAIVPVPFSAVMVERQVSAWLDGDFDYHPHSDWVGTEQISPWMPLAVMASEDQKFPYHWGFDLGAVKQVISQQGDHQRMRGASTISQQTAKNMFLWEGRSWLRKGLEAGFTVGIETIWRKRRIMTVYLNIAEFGPGIFGVEAASRAYFHKPASQLTQQQAALLAAVLPNPIRFHAAHPSAYTYQRQQWILRQMRQLGGEQFLRQNGLLTTAK